MTDYYARSFADPKGESYKHNGEPSRATGRVIAAEYGPRFTDRAKAIDSKHVELVGYPKDSLVMLVDYSPSQHNPKRDTLIFSGEEAQRILGRLGCQRPTGLEGKVITALVQADTAVGISLPDSN